MSETNCWRSTDTCGAFVSCWRRVTSTPSTTNSARFGVRDTGPAHPLEASYAHNVAAMMALVAGEFETGDSLGQRALAMADGDNELAFSFYGALMTWTWWQR